MARPIIYGLQPVREAIRAGWPIGVILLARDAGGATRELRQEAEQAGIKVVETPKRTLDERAETRRHQGVLAELDRPPPESTLADVLARAEAAAEPPLVLVLDHIEDPHNLGALIRSAHALGAHGVVIPKKRAAQVTPTVHKVSAGASTHLPVVTVTNIKHALKTLTEAGVWSAAAVMDGQTADQVDLTGPLALVIGAEGAGVRPTVAARCDHRVRIGLSRGFDSLNASVAGGILLYEVVRQRGGSKA